MNPEETEQKPVSCAKCGACVPVCPLYRLQGRESYSARGKLHLLQKLPLATAERSFAEVLSKCLLCGACSSVCPRNLDIPLMISQARGALPEGLASSPLGAGILRTGMQHPSVGRLLGGASRFLDKGLLRFLPADSGLRLKLSLPEAYRFETGKTRRRTRRPSQAAGRSDASGEVLLFEGCFARHLQKEITEATATLLADRLHLKPLSPAAQKCCGLSFIGAGQRRQALELAKSNIEAYAGDEGPILVSCASCFSHLSSYPSLFAEDPAWHAKALAFAARLCEFSSFFLEHRLAEQLARTTRKINAYYHDSCHLRFHSRITAPPRTLLQSIASLQLVEPSGGYRCCGAGGLFQLYHPDLAGGLQAELLQEVAATKASQVLATCSGCLLHLHQGTTGRGLPVKVQHLAVFLAEQLK